MQNFGVSFRVTDSDYFIIEGDEYDTAYFDKGPKFMHYLPEIAIVNNIEFDHADIYNDLDAVKLAFRRLMNLVPGNGQADCRLGQSARARGGRFVRRRNYSRNWKLSAPVKTRSGRRVTSITSEGMTRFQCLARRHEVGRVFNAADRRFQRAQLSGRDHRRRCVGS